VLPGEGDPVSAGLEGAGGHGEQDDAFAGTREQAAGEQFEVGRDDDFRVPDVKFGAGELLFVVGQRAGELDRVGLERADGGRGGGRSGFCTSVATNSEGRPPRTAVVGAVAPARGESAGRCAATVMRW
jgi:hypothetical protein